MMYAKGDREDQIHQGRMILVGTGVGCLIVWLFDYFSWPAMLLPAAFLDHTGRALSQLIGISIQFVIMGTFWILTWAGYSWARYVLGAFLLIAGLSNVIFSILMGSAGGGILVLGAMFLASAVALLLSVGVHRYLEDRRARGFPALTVGLAIMGLFFLLVGVAGIQLAQTWVMVDTTHRETETVADVFKRLIPALNVAALEPIATDEFKEQMTASDLAGQVDEMKQTLGAYQGWSGVKTPNVEQLVLNPGLAREQRTWSTLVSYEKANVFIEMEADLSQSPVEVKNIYFQRLEKNKAAK
jgi:hypothetical protein